MKALRGRLGRLERRLARVRVELAHNYDEQGRSRVEILRERRRRWRIAEERGVSVGEVMQEELAAARLADKRSGEQKQVNAPMYPADILRERMRRRLEADGQPFEEPTPVWNREERARPLSVAEVLLQSRRRAYERNSAEGSSVKSGAEGGQSLPKP